MEKSSFGDPTISEGDTFCCDYARLHSARKPGLKARYLPLRGFPGGSVVKNPLANARDVGSIPGSGRLLGGGNGNPLQYFPWEIPWTEEPGGLQSMGLQRVGHDLTTKQKQSIFKPQQKIENPRPPPHLHLQ